MPRAKKKRGPGRPSLGKEARSKLVMVRLTEAEHVAIESAVARENDEVTADATADDKDKRPATVASWIRDQALDTLGLATFDVD